MLNSNFLVTSLKFLVIAKSTWAFNQFEYVS